MVKGEHLRPLLGFAVVCVTAVLIMGTGLNPPTGLGVVAQPRAQVHEVPDTTDLVLGQTLDKASPERATTASELSPAAPAAEKRAVAVLASLSVPSSAEAAPSPTTSSAPAPKALPRRAHKHRVVHQQSHPAHPVAATQKPPAPAPVPAPAPTTVTPTPGHGSGHGAGHGPAPGSAHGPGHVPGHGVGHGVGHGGRHDWGNSTSHTAAPGPNTALVEHHQGHGHPDRHGEHSSGHDHGHGYEHHSGYGGGSRGHHH